MLEASIMGQFCDPNVIFLEGVVTKSEWVEIKIILSAVGLNGNASLHYMYTQRIARLNRVFFFSEFLFSNPLIQFIGRTRMHTEETLQIQKSAK